VTPIRVALTSLLGALSAVALGIVLIPIRSHISIATAGLILVVPVVVGVRVGGYVGGLVSVAAGFLVFDFLYIPPYYTLNVGAGQNWVALGVYVIVMFLVAQVVARLQATRREAERRARDHRQYHPKDIRPSRGVTTTA
jgi:two-component system sensor histidine kinase KdpD